MKKERLIIIKNPRLRKIRSNLRKILLLAVSDKIDELQELINSLIDEKGLDDLEHREVRKKMNKLLSLPTGSICRCGNGGSCLSLEKFGKEHPMEEMNFTDLDMAYYPKTKQWYCLECYKRTKAISEPENVDINKVDTHYQVERVEELRFEEEQRSKSWNRFGYITPGWSEMRAMVKKWGAQMVTRDLIDFLLRIMAEYVMTDDQVENVLKPLVQAGLQHAREIKEKRLNVGLVMHEIKRYFPDLLKLAIFQKKVLIHEINRSIDVVLNREEEQYLDLNLSSYLSLVLEMDFKEEILNFVLEKLPHSVSEKEIENDAIADLVEEYEWMRDFFKQHGNETQFERFEEKIHLLRENYGKYFYYD